MFSFCSKFKQKRGFTTRNQHTGLGPAVTPEFIYKSDVKGAMYFLPIPLTLQLCKAYWSKDYSNWGHVLTVLWFSFFKVSLTLSEYI